MRRLLALSVSLIAATTGASAAEPVVSRETATSPVLAPRTAPGPAVTNTPAPRLALSPDTAARLAASTPKYVAPDPGATPAPSVDLREVDRPRNSIIRLPSYLVQEPRDVVLKNREILTEEGKIDLGFQRHPGLRLGSWGIFNNNFWAREMTEEEFALQRQREMLDLLSLLPASISVPTSPTPSVFSLAPSSTFSSSWRNKIVPWERR